MLAFRWARYVIVLLMASPVLMPVAAIAQASDELVALQRQVTDLTGAGRYSEALAASQRALSLAEKRLGPEHPAIMSWVNHIAYLNDQQGRYAEAERLYKRALAMREKALGLNHPDVAKTLNNLAGSYQEQRRYAEAEPLFRRALAIREKALGNNHGDFAQSLHNLGLLLSAQGRYTEAETLFRQGLTIREKVHGTESLEVANSLFGLAQLYRNQGRYAEAERYAKRDAAIQEKKLGPNHRDTGAAIDNLATIYFYLNRFNDAEPLFKRSLAIREKLLGPDHPLVGQTMGNLAATYDGLHRPSEAEPLYLRSLRIRERALGSDNAALAAPINNLATLYHQLGRYAEAETYYKRAVAIWEKALGPDHPDIGIALYNLAVAYRIQSKFAEAEAAYRQSAEVTIRRTTRGASALGQSMTGKVESESTRARKRFAEWIKVAYQLGQGRGARQHELARKMFEAAQSAQGSEAAASLAQMAARLAKGEGVLSQLIRQRQDLAAEWQEKEKLLIQARSGPSASDPKVLNTRLAAIDRLIGDIDVRLAREFPDYSALTNPQATAIESVQAQLAPNEALVVFFDTGAAAPLPEETFIWAVTKSEMRWIRSSLGSGALISNVATLRCGLDNAAWEGPEGSTACMRMLGVSSVPVTQLPFDLARAHELYRALFGGIEDLIKDKHLLIVPSGALTVVPFQVLVTDRPGSAIPGDATGYAEAAWLAKRHALTVLPSVSSLRALRQLAKTSKAKEAFVGFGNPLLVGPNGNDKRAWDRQTCQKAASERSQVASRAVRATTAKFYRGNLADVELIRRQYPLPETADELCAVAQSAGAPQSAVHLGAKATERTVKGLSAGGVLANARVVHFATHGLLASESGMVNARAEPALILTPPTQPSEDDDGLLTASEVALLNLDADWVVLSACNTAAGGGNDLGSDEALSGLARAFFYAGARALLVSHWAVDSQATVSLVTKAFEEIRADSKLGRAQSLQRSMLGLIASGGRSAHPASWAPFVVVGEGAR
jgi:CHAT domain-containing protein/tetratricopeptide (TPR) repeat protein